MKINKKWEMAYYLMQAKLNVDSLLYLSKNINKIHDVPQKVYDKRQNFYLNVCFVLDKTICKDKNKKYSMCKGEHKDEIINDIYTQRDKYYAHKDDDYNQIERYQSLYEEAIKLEEYLKYIKTKCNDFLPECFSLDFVEHDYSMFRETNKINKSFECKLNAEPNDKKNKEYKIVYNIDDIKNIKDGEAYKYCVIIENGINDAEGLQNRQKFCILNNCLFNINMWFSFNQEVN